MSLINAVVASRSLRRLTLCLRRFASVFSAVVTVFAIVAAVAVGGCAAPVTDYQHDTDFSIYHAATLRKDPHAETSIDAARVDAALKKYLPARGILIAEEVTEEMEGEEAALEVVSRFVPYRRYESDNVAFGYGVARRDIGVGITAPVVSEERKQYRLEITFVDRGNQQVIWRVRSADRMDEDLSAPRRDKWVDNTVREMLSMYPPAQSKASDR